MGMAIEDAALAAVNQPSAGSLADVAQASGYFSTDEHVSPIGALLKAQSRFIRAQTAFIHDQDVNKLATAQEEFILAQNQVIEDLGVI
jgi:hypothetical protein